jgi:ADP-ribose pyrophosphatase YjhB (NUDIX family)
LSALIKYAFETVKLNRLWACYRPQNPNSGAVMRKSGMRHEGTFRQNKVRNGQLVDTIQYAILAEDYFAAAPQLKRFPTHIVAVDGVVENERGEILLVKNHYGWVQPGGQVENGETLIDALKREIREESGAEVSVGRLICVSSNTKSRPGDNGYETIPTKVAFTFICKYESGELRTSDETSEVKWVAKSEVLDFVTSPVYKERISHYISGDLQVKYIAYTTRPEVAFQVNREI